MKKKELQNQVESLVKNALRLYIDEQKTTPPIESIRCKLYDVLQQLSNENLITSSSYYTNINKSCFSVVYTNLYILSSTAQTLYLYNFDIPFNELKYKRNIDIYEELVRIMKCANTASIV